MAKLALVGTIEVAPGRKDQLLSALMAHKARCLRDEPGTLQMEVLAPREDDTKCLCMKSIETMRHSTCIEADRPWRNGERRRPE